MPKSFMIVYFTLFAFIAILVVTVVVTPVQMNWLAFLLSLFTAFGVGELIYKRGRTDKT
jgi:hypothetical protein